MIFAFIFLALYLLTNLQAAYGTDSDSTASSDKYQTKEDIYNSNPDFQIFTNPEDFIKKYSLRRDSEFNADNYDYFYYNRKVLVNVGEDNTIDVSEFIDVYFRSPMTGITRILPLYSNVAQEHDITEINRVNISGVTVDSTYTTVIKNDCLYIKTGGSTAITGFNRYNLHYKYELGKDPLKNADEFLMYIIGTDADRPTVRCQFEINFPKPIDKDNVHIYSNRNDDGFLEYSVDDKKITGETTSYLESGERIFCKVYMEDGYFSKASRVYDIASIISISSVTVIVIICMYIYFLSAKRNTFGHTIEYYPPHMLSSLEASYLRRGRADDKGIISLLPYLAQRKFFEITELSKDGSSQSKANSGYIFRKKSNKLRMKPDEKVFLNGMFKNADKNSALGGEDEEVIFDDSLKYSFYKYADNIKEMTEKREGSYAGFFAPFGIHVRLKYEILVLLLSFLSISLPASIMIGGGDFSLIILALMTLIISVPQIIARFFKITARIIMYMFLDAISIIGIAQAQSLVISQKTALITAVAAVSVLSTFSCLVDDIRTPYGTKLYGRILSFEKTFSMLDKRKMTELCEKDPNYFYNVFPYIYSLDMTNVWSLKIKQADMERPPEWYDMTDEYSEFTARRFLYMMTSVSDDMLSSPINRNNGANIISNEDINRILGK